MYMKELRKEFPMLETLSHGNPLLYFDSAATSLKPKRVIDAMSSFYSKYYSTVNRAIYSTALKATDLYFEAREKVQHFLKASHPHEIIFTKNATDSLNILADSFSISFLSPQKTVLVSEMEHHANLVPWQMACKRSGAHLKKIPIHDNGSLNLEALKTLLHENDVAVVALTHASNVLGIINPIQEISTLVHNHKAYLIVDGAQSAPHLPIDVQSLGCDAFVFSAHKTFGPTGLGILWGKESLLNTLLPTRGGGDMIESVSFEKSAFGPLPFKFEPGTPPIAEVIGLKAALDFIDSLSMKNIQAHEEEVFSYLLNSLKSQSKVKIVGDGFPRIPVVSFQVESLHPLDLATFLDLQGIAVRSGHLCAQPLLKRLGHQALIRASLSLYNTKEEVDLFLDALSKAIHSLSS
jgi:cysteine desulfurase / selenocysteine lyase